MAIVIVRVVQHIDNILQSHVFIPNRIRISFHAYGLDAKRKARRAGGGRVI